MLFPTASPIRAIIFDLDEVLLTRKEAWRYALEQAVIAVTGERIDAAPLVDEYRTRPWRQALSVVLNDRSSIDRCEGLCREMFARSSMKKLLVHEGVGMGLDAVRGHLTEIGAISREPHNLALKQVQSTGLDRFLSVLSATPEGGEWNPRERFDDCLRFLECDPSACAYVGIDAYDLRETKATGAICCEARWAAPSPTGFPAVATPADLAGLLTGKGLS